LNLTKLNSAKITYFSITAAALFLTLTQCAKNFDGENFAPSNAQAVIEGVTANGGGSLYCSISGGCPLQVTGSDFFEGAKAYIGPYECLNTVISSDHKQINCNVGPGKSGVFDVSVLNKDGKASVFASGVNSSALQFSYASFLYLGVQDSPGKVYGYAQNPVSGALLTLVDSPFSIAGNNTTYGVVISPNNKFLYAANYGSKTISVYSINPLNGTLTAVGTPKSSNLLLPNGLSIHPNGKYLYVTDGQNSAAGKGIDAFTIAEDGTLTDVPGTPFSSGSAYRINGVVINPSGEYLYAASMAGSKGVVGFSISATDGSLTLLAGSPFSNSNDAVPNSGDGVAIHPNGRWLYMGLVQQKRVAAYSIDASTGALTGIGTTVLNNSTTGYTDDNGSGANVSPDGLHFYGTAFSPNGADPKKIIVYNIDQVTGAVSLASEADSGGGPNDIRIDTNGKFAYTCNTNNSPSVSAYSRDSTTGALTALSPRDLAIPTANNGPGIMFIQK
jgi:6-phosphogluconolactonase (cycloisomerase 2 family)